MAFITPFEIFDIIVMSFAIGFIFSGRLPIPKDDEYDPILEYKEKINWREILLSAGIVAPGIILHEISHKIVALSFGLGAEFHASYLFLILGVLMKLVNFGLIFFVPAYVSITGVAANWQFALIAIAGPLTNLLLWVTISILLKFKLVKKKHIPMFMIGKKVNLFLFIFNVIPIPGFDGFQALMAVVRMFS